MLGMLADLVKHQPYRASLLASHGTARTALAHAFLSDGKHIIFFRGHFSVTGTVVTATRVDESLPLLLADKGMKCLDALLSSSPAALGFVQPMVTLKTGETGETFEFKSLLGTGATSLVYSAALVTPGPAASGSGSSSSLVEEPNFAIKILTSSDAAHMDGECDVLQKLGKSPHFLQFIAADAGKQLLVCSPVCYTGYSLRGPPPELSVDVLGECLTSSSAVSSAADFKAVWRPKAKDFCDMIDSLAELHVRGFAHRDTRVENFMRDKEGHMLLLDLGAAVAIGSPHNSDRPFGFTYGPIRVLEAMANGDSLPNARAADDFEQLARVALVTATGASPRFGSSDPDALLRNWQALDSNIQSSMGDGPAVALLALLSSPDGIEDVETFKQAIKALLM